MYEDQPNNVEPTAQRTMNAIANVNWNTFEGLDPLIATSFSPAARVVEAHQKAVDDTIVSESFGEKVQQAVEGSLHENPNIRGRIVSYEVDWLIESLESSGLESTEVNPTKETTDTNPSFGVVQSTGIDLLSTFLFGDSNKLGEIVEVVEQIGQVFEVSPETSFDFQIAQQTPLADNAYLEYTESGWQVRFTDPDQWSVEAATLLESQFGISASDLRFNMTPETHMALLQSIHDHYSSLTGISIQISPDMTVSELLFQFQRASLFATEQTRQVINQLLPEGVEFIDGRLYRNGIDMDDYRYMILGVDLRIENLLHEIELQGKMWMEAVILATVFDSNTLMPYQDPEFMQGRKFWLLETIANLKPEIVNTPEYYIMYGWSEERLVGYLHSMLISRGYTYESVEGLINVGDLLSWMEGYEPEVDYPLGTIAEFLLSVFFEPVDWAMTAVATLNDLADDGQISNETILQWILTLLPLVSGKLAKLAKADNLTSLQDVARALDVSELQMARQLVEEFRIRNIEIPPSVDSAYHEAWLTSVTYERKLNLDLTNNVEPGTLDINAPNVGQHRTGVVTINNRKAHVNSNCNPSEICMPRDPGVAAKYPQGVYIDRHGMPDFTPYSEISVRIELTGNRGNDKRRANQAAGLSETPDDFVWHHHEDMGVMQLVPSDLHSNIAHTGGFPLYNKR